MQLLQVYVTEWWAKAFANTLDFPKSACIFNRSQRMFTIDMLCPSDLCAYWRGLIHLYLGVKEHMEQEKRSAGDASSEY